MLGAIVFVWRSAPRVEADHLLSFDDRPKAELLERFAGQRGFVP